MGSFYIGRLWGIDIRIHFLFPLFVGLFALMDAVQYGIMAGVISLLLLLLVFVFVLAHEMGHSLMAKHYGIYVKDITLWPLGGIANLSGTIQSPLKEIKIALAGPAVNFALALLLLPIAVVTHILAHTNFVVYLVAVNLMLMLFNLLPAFPMDGGRIYRAWLARKTDYLEATRKASQIGTIIAIVLCCIGIFSNPFLIFISLFIIIAGKEELARVEAQSNQLWGAMPQTHFSFFYENPPHNSVQFRQVYINPQMQEFFSRFFRR